MITTGWPQAACGSARPAAEPLCAEVGCARWRLLPAAACPQVVLPVGVEREAATWFRAVFPRTQAPHWQAPRPLTIIQQPGEVGYVPYGWWHAVLNLDLTIAVTHNYASSVTFPSVWLRTLKGRPKLSGKWLDALRCQRPDLAQVADRLKLAAAHGDSWPPVCPSIT